MTDLRHIVTTAASAPFASYSQAVVWDRIVATAGQLGTDPQTGNLPAEFADEVAQAIANLAAVLQAAGSGLDQVVKTTCLLSDIDLFPTFDRVYREHFPQPWPARSTMGIQLAGAFRVEIEAWAVRGDQEAR